jgi:thiol-disulfide isomerase/thioredoxin
MKLFTQTLSILALLTIFAFAGCGSEETDSSSNELQAATPGKKAEPEAEPLFKAYDIEGTLRSSNEWLGKKPTVVNIWGTWCPPCRREIPDLVRLYNEYRDKGIEIVGIAVERGDPSRVAPFAKSHNMDWVMLIGSQEHVNQFKVSGVPTTMFFDKEGNLATVTDANGQKVDRFTGMRDYNTFKKAFEQIVSE